MFFKENSIGIYIHYPFCKEICPYCDFNKYLDLNLDYNLLFNVYKKEIDFFASKLSSEKILYSIYFGGGTPSLMNEKLIEKIIDYIFKIFKKNDFVEITLEANPTSFEVGKFKNFYHAGVNRISLGVQSFIDKELQFLGRRHSSKQAEFAIKSSQDIFSKVTFDLIYGLPNQTIENWNFNLEKAYGFNIKHISLYNLTIKEGTPFYLFVKNGRMKEKSEEEMAEFIDFTWGKMKENNFYHYEISNFSADEISFLNDVKSNSNIAIHNMLYWKYFEYIGIGAGACGRIKIENDLYETKIVNSLKPWLSFDNSIELIKLNLEDKIHEILISGLRSKFGIDFQNIFTRFGINLLEYLNLNKIESFKQDNLICMTEENLTLTEKGMKFIDYLTVNILK